MTRPQRIVVLCAMCYTSLATSAFLFTTDDFRVTRVLQTACVSAVILFPMGYGVPMLFRMVRRSTLCTCHARVLQLVI